MEEKVFGVESIKLALSIAITAIRERDRTGRPLAEVANIITRTLIKVRLKSLIQEVRDLTYKERLEIKNWLIDSQLFIEPAAEAAILDLESDKTSTVLSLAKNLLRKRALNK